MTTTPTTPDLHPLRQALSDSIERTDIAAAGMRLALDRALARGFDDAPDHGSRRPIVCPDIE